MTISEIIENIEHRVSRVKGYPRHPKADRMIKKQVAELNAAITALRKSEKYLTKAVDAWVKSEYPDR